MGRAAGLGLAALVSTDHLWRRVELRGLRALLALLVLQDHLAQVRREVHRRCNHRRGRGERAMRDAK